MRTRISATGKRGFTLVELLVTLAIISLVTALAMPLFQNMLPAARLQAGIEKIAEVLQSTRRNALQQRKTEEVVFFLRDHEYGAGGQRYTAPGTLSLRLKGKPVATDISAVRFYPDGSADAANITLADGTHSRAVQVDWLTGAVQIEHD